MLRLIWLSSIWMLWQYGGGSKPCYPSPRKSQTWSQHVPPYPLAQQKVEYHHYTWPSLSVLYVACFVSQAVADSIISISRFFMIALHISPSTIWRSSIFIRTPLKPQKITLRHREITLRQVKAFSAWPYLDHSNWFIFGVPNDTTG